MTRRPMPPPLRIPKPGLWRSTPPAIFPPIMGLFGLGLAWRAAAPVYGFPPAIGDLILGAVSLLYLFALVAYLAKPLRRPGVVAEDLRVLPGRAGLAAASLTLMLMAASLTPFLPGVAGTLALVAFVVHLAFVALFVQALRAGPPEGRVVTPVFHLSFVGFILGGLVANALGYPEIARILVWSMLLATGLIWGVSLRQMLSAMPPAPLRPLLAIHLAPASVLTIVAYGAGMPAATSFSVLSVVIFITLLASARWLMASGFSPLWGAFTFPLAAFAAAMVQVSSGQGVIGLLGAVVLLAATGAVPYISFRIFRMWAEGKLAAKTNAAEA